MKIAIVGAVGEGTTHLIDTVLFKALISHDDYRTYGFDIREHGLLTAHRGGTPMLHIAAFHATQLDEVVEWLKSPEGVL